MAAREVADIERLEETYSADLSAQKIYIAHAFHVGNGRLSG